MFSKTNLISTVVGAIWAYFGGYLLWEVIGSSLFSAPESPTPDQMHLIIACVISAFAFSVIYSKLAGGEHSLSHGATYGLWVGIFIGLGERWFDFAFDTTPVLQDAIINGVLNIVFFVVLGALVSAIYGKVK
ncbi:MAG TPA: hypothetical protein VGA80_03795 [Flavobacteriaceae bacterium]|jgi:hypothetical protein